MSEQIEKTVDLNAPIERVWKALTDPVEFATWFRVRMETGFTVGEVARGRILHPGYEHLVWEATITLMEPPTRFAFTWHPYGVDKSIDYSKEIPTLVEFTLTATPQGTRLVVIESGFENVPEYRRDEAFRMNSQGWAIQVENIKRHVES